MQTSVKGVAFIAAFEGVVTKAYRDVGGTLTIGVGHTAAAGPPVPVLGMTITRDRAFAILATDLKACEARVAVALPGVVQTVFDAAVSFDFNTGAIDRASWVAAYRKGDLDGARAGLLLWVKAGGNTVAGLVCRREAEATLLVSGDYGPEGDGVAPTVAARRSLDDVRAVQMALATLGLYHGAIDGISGPDTAAAVRAYQASHPDLIVDGVPGPATRASIDRDLAARRRIGAPAAIGVAGTAAAGLAVAAGGHGLLPLLLGAAVLVFAIVEMARHSADLARIFPLRKR